MIDSNEIHRSFIEAEDIEEIPLKDIPQDGLPITDVFLNLLRHPGQVIARWNWKVALIGSLVRASFYFTVYKASKESWIVTLAAVLLEIGFRFLTSGIFGSMVQSFRRASPPWLATLIITIVFPALSHLVEYITHFAQEHWFSSVFPKPESDDARLRAFAISVLFSALSTLFNIYVMRHNVLLVGAGSETKNFKDDLKNIPILLAQFVIFLPTRIFRFAAKGKVLQALGIFLSFGLIVGGILGGSRGKWAWAYSTALGAWGILLFATIIAAIVESIALYNERKRSKEI